MASVREAERQRDPEALRLKGGTTTKFNKFLNYDEAVRAANCHQMLTDIMFYVFWVAFFTMVLVVFLYYDLNNFKLQGAAWYGSATVVCGSIAVIYLLYRLFDCLAFVF
ncbi:hypothetical protein AAMO2058_001280600 [Amorphochlora amoebiformis]